MIPNLLNTHSQANLLTACSTHYSLAYNPELTSSPTNIPVIYLPQLLYAISFIFLLILWSSSAALGCLLSLSSFIFPT